MFPAKTSLLISSFITFMFSSLFVSNNIVDGKAMNPSFKAFNTWDCGDASKVIHFQDASINPSPIVYPGDISIRTEMRVLEDLPTHNLKVRVSIDKLEPQRMQVPCFHGIGSCVYDVCNDVIPQNQAAFCAMGACSCPLITKTYTASSVPYVLPELGGPIFAQILEGNFDGNITFFNSETDQRYGCLGMQFSIRAKL